MVRSKSCKLTSWVVKEVYPNSIVYDGFLYASKRLLGIGFQVAIHSRNSYLATPRGEKMPIEVHPYRDPGEWEHGTLKYLSFLEVIIYPLRIIIWRLVIKDFLGP